MIRFEDALRALREKATPGPWKFSDLGMTSVFTMHEDSWGGGVCVPEDAYPRGGNHPTENMRLIACVASPERVALIEDVLRAARELYDEYLERNGDQTGGVFGSALRALDASVEEKA